jgi:molybdopterin synthase catalytic subunit
MAASARLEPGDLDPAAELGRFLEGRGADGAVVSFTGLVRSASKAGEPVERIELDWYPGLTDRSLGEIAEDALRRFGVSDVLVVHRCGTVRAGAPVVFAAAAAPHRRDAFLAADYLMDRLKTDAAFWKREDGPEGGRWIEPTEEDHRSLKRWEST